LNDRAVSKNSVLIAASLVALGCISAKQRGYPLYAASDVARSREEVAGLTGYVERVDGVDVTSHGASFELLPGCHWISTPRDWGKVESGSGGVIVTTGRVNFVLPMKAGQSYRIEVRKRVMGGLTDAVVVEATEQDASGHTTTVFTPTTSREAIEACRPSASPPLDAGTPQADVEEPRDGGEPATD
jgi:hypothetical protein